MLALAAVLGLSLGAFALAGDAETAAAPNTNMEVRKSSETASVAAVVGRVTAESGGESARVNAATTFHAGDAVTVASGGRLTVKLADGATLAMLGPAKMRFIELNPGARRVMLESGVVSEAFMQGVAIEVATPYDASLVLQNATGFARVVPGDRVMFQKTDGETAQVFHQNRLQPLDGGWTLNVRSGTLSKGALANAAGDEGGRAVMRRMVIGHRQVAWGPPEDFKVQQADGKVQFTYTGDDYGVVKVGPHSTVFFLSSGESITFDENGQVVQFDGISHIYHPLNSALPDYDEPVENAADASVSNPGRR